MFTRIVSNPAILAGKPCIKGTRISVEMILEWVASGASRNDIVNSYPRGGIAEFHRPIAQQ